MSAITDNFTDSASGNFMVMVSSVHTIKRAKRQQDSKSDTWRAGRRDDCRAGQTCRRDVARQCAADSNESPKTKAALLTSASVRARHRAKPTGRPPRLIRIVVATLSASSSRPPPWTIDDSTDALKPTMAGHSPELTLQFWNLMFS